MSSEHRIEARQRVFLKGRISFNNGASSMDCLVRDMSATGARLALTETATLPERFDLFVPQKDRTYKCVLRWRRHDGIGITFADETSRAAPPVAPPIVPAVASAPPPAEEPPPADPTVMVLLHRVRELEAENASLRRLIASMAQPGSEGQALQRMLGATSTPGDKADAA